ncbi:glycosyltransferase family 39 protein, partial [Acidobacteria bacterium AH-259-D05]|nr:glycosyltransferase family 39 protein [Acidobacteria bacterium AH-259-D05]
MFQRWWVALFCASVIYLTLFYQLGNLAFVGADEPRYARIGEEMNLRGSYLTPTLNFIPWLEKPPLLFWLEAGSFRLFGVHEWSARLPAVTLALVSLLMVALLVFDLKGARVAIFTVLILCTSGLFFVFARAASTDTLLVAMLSAAMVCGFQATRRGSNLWAGTAGLALGLAVLAKGPVAVVLFAGVFGLYFLLTQRLQWNVSQIAFLIVLFSLTAVPWFWEVWEENGYSFIATFWINHHLARFLTDIHHHSQPFWYYLPVLVIGFFPWIFFLGSAFLRTWRRGKHLLDPNFRLELFLWLWVGIPFAFFSLSESKLAGYILPVIPPLAVIVAMEWNQWIQGDLISQRTMRIQVMVLGGFALLVSGSLLWGFYSVYGAPGVGILLAFPILAGMGWALFELQRRRPASIFLSLVAAMTLFASLAYWRAAPVVDDYHSARDLCQLILPRISNHEPLILYRYFHHTAHYYTRYQATKESVSDLPGLNDYFQDHPQSRYYLLTQEAGRSDLHLLEASLMQHQGNLY